MDDLLLPLFPLEIVLLPEEVLPLHIFEERYKQMIGECLEAESTGSGQREFGVVFAKDGEVQTLGCSAQITEVIRRYGDGRMDILTAGQRRFEVLFTDDEKPYLRGGVTFFDDEGGRTPSQEEVRRAIELLRETLERLRQDEIPALSQQPSRHVSFRIAAALPLDLDFKQQLLSVCSEAERLGTLTQLMEQIIPRLDLAEKARAKAGGNGDVRQLG